MPLFQNYLVYSQGYCLLSSLRVETTSFLSTAIPTSKGTHRCPVSIYQVCTWICSIWICTTESQFLRGRSHTCEKIQQRQEGITHPNSILVTPLPLTVKLWAKENLSFGPGSHLLVGETSINAAFLIKGCCESWIRKYICEVNSFIFLGKSTGMGMNEWNEMEINEQQNISRPHNREKI